ncbi:hypothetical protein ACFYOK_35410, partial [Microbispora bryophytorum]
AGTDSGGKPDQRPGRGPACRNPANLSGHPTSGCQQFVGLLADGGITRVRVVVGGQSDPGGQRFMRRKIVLLDRTIDQLCVEGFKIADEICMGLYGFGCRRKYVALS